MEKLKHYWLNLSTREQQLLLIGTIVLGILLAYLICWLPLAQAVKTRQQMLLEQNQLLMWMKKASIDIRQAGMFSAAHNKIENDDLTTTIKNSLAPYQLTAQLSNMQMFNNKLHLTFQSVPFDQWITWLLAINQQYALQIDSVTLQKAKKIGTVDVELFLQQH